MINKAYELLLTSRIKQIKQRISERNALNDADEREIREIKNKLQRNE